MSMAELLAELLAVEVLEAERLVKLQATGHLVTERGTPARIRASREAARGTVLVAENLENALEAAHIVAPEHHVAGASWDCLQTSIP